MLIAALAVAAALAAGYSVIAATTRRHRGPRSPR